MRIIAGRAKGRRLKAPPGLETRPMTDRVREALFSSLGASIEGAHVLDLYAGSGSLGLEALSRGAAGAVFVENTAAAIACLEANVAAVRLGGRVIGSGVTDYLEEADEDFGLVFVDPPFALPADSLGVVLKKVARVLASGGMVVVHRRTGDVDPIVPADMAIRDRRRYGDSVLLRLEAA